MVHAPVLAAWLLPSSQRETTVREEVHELTEELHSLQAVNRHHCAQRAALAAEKVRFPITGIARIKYVGKSQSCMVSGTAVDEAGSCRDRRRGGAAGGGEGGGEYR